MSFYFSDISTFVKRIIKIFWLANAAFSKLRSIFKSNAVSTEVKYKLFEAYITSIFTYNCELWTLAKELENEIDVFQRCLLRQILKVHYPRKITVWENSPSTFVTNSEIQTLKGAWTKKLSNSNCTQGSSQKSEKKTPKGGQIATWISIVNRQLKELEVPNFEIAETIAQDRKLWSSLISRTMSPSQWRKVLTTTTIGRFCHRDGTRSLPYYNYYQ